MRRTERTLHQGSVSDQRRRKTHPAMTRLPAGGFCARHDAVDAVGACGRCVLRCEFPSDFRVSITIQRAGVLRRNRRAAVARRTARGICGMCLLPVPNGHGWGSRSNPIAPTDEVIMDYRSSGGSERGPSERVTCVLVGGPDQRSTAEVGLLHRRLRGLRRVEAVAPASEGDAEPVATRAG
jgi:hypothetical protein